MPVQNPPFWGRLGTQAVPRSSHCTQECDKHCRTVFCCPSMLADIAKRGMLLLTLSDPSRRTLARGNNVRADTHKIVSSGGDVPGRLAREP